MYWQRPMERELVRCYWAKHTVDSRSNSSLNSNESLKNGTGQHSSVDSNDSSSVPSNIIDASTGGYVVFIYGIGPETTQEEVLNIFQGFGPILRTDVIKNKRTTIGKGLIWGKFRSNATVEICNSRLRFRRLSTYEWCFSIDQSIAQYVLQRSFFASSISCLKSIELFFFPYSVQY